MTTISIIGLGQVGRALAFLLCREPEGLLLNFVDPSLNPGAIEDLLHAHADQNRVFAFNDQDALLSSDVIFHCAGPRVPEGYSRRAVRNSSLALTTEIFSPLALSRHQPLVVVLANPVDVISLKVAQLTGLHPGRILGTGTLLDTRRLNSLLERELELPSGEAQAILLGEHGESMTLWTGGSRISGIPILDALPWGRLQGILEKVGDMATFIKRYQGATFYGVSNCALDLWKWFREPSTRATIASVQVPESLSKKWGLEPLFMSLPVVLGGGQVDVLAGEFSGEDDEALRRSAVQILSVFDGEA